MSSFNDFNFLIYKQSEDFSISCEFNITNGFTGNVFEIDVYSNTEHVLYQQMVFPFEHDVIHSVKVFAVNYAHKLEECPTEFKDFASKGLQQLNVNTIIMEAIYV